MTHRSKATQEKIRQLYLCMPGAPLPPTEDGSFLWGEVEGNDHWNFCRQIVETLVKLCEERDAAKGGAK